jgi:hypothetical protein
LRGWGGGGVTSEHKPLGKMIRSCFPKLTQPDFGEQVAVIIDGAASSSERSAPSGAFHAARQAESLDKLRHGPRRQVGLDEAEVLLPLGWPHQGISPAAMECKPLRSTVGV